MSLLHDYFNTRNLQAFQRLLDGNVERGATTSGAPGSSYTGGGKSWTRGGGVMASVCKVNARDWLGRTVLHLACNALENIEYARALLKHPNIDVNLPDTENLWTPLHRALYAANLPVALLLLSRPDIDTNLKDIEGYTAFDLYNSTVAGTKPEDAVKGGELYTWGVNRNAALGVGDENDRVYPEHVAIQSKEDSATLSKKCLTGRFSPIRVRQVEMSKLHTAVVTAEREGNIRLCGFGSGGRLGPAQHTQYSLNPLPSLNLEIVSVALGQDHTLALTRSGEIYSWGLNRFAQLGYIVETVPSVSGRVEEPMQTTPKRVVGLLRREIVRGVAASKNASACWTADAVYTWGTNMGQLGYDKNAQPVQVLPRSVTKFTSTVIDLAMSDTVLAALLENRNVECLWNDRHYRISFPGNPFPSGITPYRPPQSIRDSRISKITCCDDTFAALSLNGEVFTFCPPKALGDSSTGEGRAFSPQRIWALRKKFSSVKDVALGSEGSIIICTESGHVFVRTRSTKNASSKAFKFERVPFLQRVTKVCANSTGAFGALKVDYQPQPIEITGNTLSQDMKGVQPYLELYKDHDAAHITAPRSRVRSHWNPSQYIEEEPEDQALEGDIASVLELCRVLACERRMRKEGGGSVDYRKARLPHGADTLVHLSSGEVFPVHRAILSTRSHVLSAVLAGSGAVVERQSHIGFQLLSPSPGPSKGIPSITRVSVSNAHPLAVLILLHYLYSDELLAVWDPRIGSAMQTQAAVLGMNTALIRAHLQALAQLLELRFLEEGLAAPVRRDLSPSIADDMGALFDRAQTHAVSRVKPDVVLQFMDRSVYAHSVVLRARSPLFASFFGIDDWTSKRWEADGTVRVNMKHLTAHVMDFVMRFMCCGADEEMFHHLDFIDSTEDLIPFMFEVLAAANELHLDRLVLLCSSVILQHTSLSNACYVLADATQYRIPALVDSLHSYCAATLEALLEARMLDVLPYALVKELSRYVQRRQIEKAPFSRGSAHVSALLERHAEWLALQDIPEPTLRHTTTEWRREGAPSRVVLPRKASPPLAAAEVPHALRRPPSGDDIFAMDSEATPEVEQGSAPVWKAHGAPRVDMKAVMAEAAASQRGTRTLPRGGPTKMAIPGSGSGTPEASGSNMPVKGSPQTGTSPAWRSNNPAAPEARSQIGPVQPTTPISAVKAKARDSLGATGSLPPVPPMGLLSGTRPPPSPKPSGPVLGPVITPTRQTPTKASGSNNNSSYGRNAGSTKAWASPQPVRAPVTAAPMATRGMSFVAIQHLQQEQVAPVKDRRTLIEIQAEERALQEEADFLIWWTAEEERVRQEELALAQFANTLDGKEKSRPPRRQRPPKQKKTETPQTASPAGGAREQTSKPQIQRPRKSRPTPNPPA